MARDKYAADDLVVYLKDKYFELKHLQTAFHL